MFRSRISLAPLARRVAVLLGSIAVVVCMAPAPAWALTLSDWVSGGGFSTDRLSFSDFEVSFAGDLVDDPTSYPVIALEDGFRLGGPLSVVMGGDGSLLLSYTVTVLDDLEIVGASLFAEGLVMGDGAQAVASTVLFDAPGAAAGSLATFAVAGVGSVASDALGLAPRTALSVVQSIQVRGGDLAAIPWIEQRFVAVPEVGTLLLVSVGLLGVSFVGRRRRP
jgi:hypothetical protein